MNHFKSIEEILSSDFGLLSDGYEEKQKTDRVLKPTKIEQAIYEDLSSDCVELALQFSHHICKRSFFKSLFIFFMPYQNNLCV